MPTWANIGRMPRGQSSGLGRAPKAPLPDCPSPTHVGAVLSRFLDGSACLLFGSLPSVGRARPSRVPPSLGSLRRLALMLFRLRFLRARVFRVFLLVRLVSCSLAWVWSLLRALGARAPPCPWRTAPPTLAWVFRVFLMVRLVTCWRAYGARSCLEVRDYSCGGRGGLHAPPEPPLHLPSWRAHVWARRVGSLLFSGCAFGCVVPPRSSSCSHAAASIGTSRWPCRHIAPPLRGRQHRREGRRMQIYAAPTARRPQNYAAPTARRPKLPRWGT